MARFMIKMSYTPQALATMVENPQNRAEAVKPVVEALGGTMEGWWMTLGGCEAITILTVPDVTSIAALAMAIQGGGAVRDLQTTQLLDSDEYLETMNLAGSTGYEIPW